MDFGPTIEEMMMKREQKRKEWENIAKKEKDLQELKYIFIF
jgi:hypothetical protein